LSIGADSSWCESKFSILLQDPSTHDVTFKTSDGGSVSAHRLIVTAGSPVFHAMLYGNMKESTQKEIELPNIDGTLLKQLFYFIYTGHVKASVSMCLTLFQTADYFDVSELKALCVRIIKSKLCIENCRYVATFAVTHQIDTLITACVNFMEDRASFLVYCDFEETHSDPYPLPAIVAFLKSSDLDVCELDLFLSIVLWCENQKDLLNPDDIKSVFELIRYPLIQKDHLIEKVHPTNMADPDLYKAALEYHDTLQYDGPEIQITMRKFYFDFDPVFGLMIEHTPKGTVITKLQSLTRKQTCMVKIDFDTTIRFIFCLKNCSNKRKTKLFLSYGATSDCNSYDDVNVESIPIGEEVAGSFYYFEDFLNVEIGDEVLCLSTEDFSTMYFGITLYSEGDQISIFKTYHC